MNRRRQDFLAWPEWHRLVNFGVVHEFKVESLIETFGQGACGFAAGGGQNLIGARAPIPRCSSQSHVWTTPLSTSFVASRFRARAEKDAFVEQLRQQALGRKIKMDNVSAHTGYLRVLAVPRTIERTMTSRSS
jgi:hypothetical protein